MPHCCLICKTEYSTKTNLNRHLTNPAHLKQCTEVEELPKTNDSFKGLELKVEALEGMIIALIKQVSEQAVALASLSEVNKSLIFEASQTRMKHVHEVEASALVLANEKLARAHEVAALAAPTNLVAQLQAQTAAIMELQTKVNKPRRTGEENDQILIEKWFKHPRKYPHLPPSNKKGEEPYRSGFTDLCTKLQDKFTETPDLDRADYEERLFYIFNEEVYEKSENGMSYMSACMSLAVLHKCFKFSEKYDQIMDDFKAEMETGMAKRERDNQ
jgi:hypothetical protein